LSTAIDRRAFAAPADLDRNLLAETGFAIFLLLIFIGLKPFAIRDQTVLLNDSGTGAGDIWRQITYLGAFVLIAAGAWQRCGSRVLVAVSPVLGLLLLWCLATSFWAIEPAVTMRRAGLEIVIVLSTMLGVQALGAERACAFLRYVLGAVLIINWVSIPLVHQAVHLSDEADPALIGNWRGLYFHKNITGAVSAITAILFLFEALRTRRWTHWLLFAAAVVFTVMTRSKSSLGLLPLAALAGLAYGYVRRKSLDVWILATAGGLFVAAAALAAIVDLHAIGRFLTDPTELTGRVAIWQGEFGFIRDHPLLGAGFGSFADTGALSPLYNYVADKWVQGESHGHNAYLQLCVTIGGVGFALAMMAFILQPALAFARIEQRDQLRFLAPLFALFVFIVLHNFVESDYLEGDGPAWVAFLLVLACLRPNARPETARPAARRLQWVAP
jgi:exopolysaccharide production protein ExoQ